MARVTLAELQRKKSEKRKFSCLTAYDASMAALVDRAGVDVVLIGDSLGMVVQGQESTIAVSLEDIIYHTKCVTTVAQHALVMADMPFMSYHTVDAALINCARVMREAGAHLVKLEVNFSHIATVTALAAANVPVCAHIGLLPQAVHKIGGYKVQGKSSDAVAHLVKLAVALEEAGADMLLLECVTVIAVQQIMQAVSIPVIGIGAGSETDGQVLVIYDMLGITNRKPARFVKNFLAETNSAEAAVRNYIAAVTAGEFPAAEHQFD